MKPTALLLSAFSLLLAVFVYFVPNERFPNSADDWSYLFQARLFASGRVYAEDSLYDRAHPLHQYLGTNCVTDYHGRRFSKYPPGWPLLLAAGSAAGAEWLVGPVLGALLVVLVLADVERRVGSEWVRPAWLLLALCAFLTYTFQSFRSHTATMVCLFGAFLVYDTVKREAERGAWRVFASGTLIGYASLIRYVDWIPLAVWITCDLLRQAPQRGRRRSTDAQVAAGEIERRVGGTTNRVARIAAFAAGFALLASGNLFYDALLSGNPFATPTALNGALSPHDHLVASWRGFVVTGVRLGAVLYAFPPVILLVLLWRRYGRRSPFRVNVALFLMSVAVYFFYVGAIGGPGPRYLASYFPFLIVATVDAWRWMHVADAGRARRLWRYAIVAQILCSLVFAGIEIRRVYERKDLTRAVERLEPGRKIVLLKTGPRGETWADSTRNPAALSSADVLYFGWGDSVGLGRLVERFPGRRVYVYEYPGVIYPRTPPPAADRFAAPQASPADNR